MIPSLPGYVFIDDATLQRAYMPNVLRSEMEVGPQKTRPIQSKPMFQTSMDISICLKDLGSFNQWFRESIGFGSYWFLMNDPFDGTRRRFRFVSYDYSWRKVGDLMQTNIVVEAYDGAE